MSPTIIIGLTALIPTALIFILRVNGSLAFLSLCLGYLLDQYVAGAAKLKLSGVVTKVANPNLKLVILLAPLLLVVVLMLKSVKKTHMLLNLVPALATGILAVILVVPLLGPNTTRDVLNSSVWKQYQSYQEILILGGATISLFFLFLSRPHLEKKHGKHHSS